MDKFELQRLRDLPIEGVAERLGLQVRRHKCLCPFHNDHHASLSFCVRKNMYRCFVCGASGGTIDLVMNYLNKDFLDACRWLGGNLTSDPLPAPIPSDARPPVAFPYRAGNDYFQGQEVSTPLHLGRGTGEGLSSRYARFFEHPFLNEAARKFLFEERRLDERVVRWCRLSSWQDGRGVPWLQIPYYNREGLLTGIQNRNLVKGALPRFRFPQGSQCGIYNLPVLNRLREGEALYITEGCSDCWAMLSAGHKAIAIPSATLLMPKDVELLSDLNARLSTEFHMYPDRDEPGERLFLQLHEVLPNLEHHQLPPDCKDFSEYYLLTKRKEVNHG